LEKKKKEENGSVELKEALCIEKMYSKNCCGNEVIIKS
jgi:hypothetical protein